MPKKKSNEERFWAKVDKKSDDECWNWKGSLSNGYGLFCYPDSGKYRHMNANRYSFLLHNGYLPEDKDICHSCDNPSCENPAHLWAGTVKENMNDRDAKGRTWVPRGEDCKKKLKRQEVDEIRELIAEGILTFKQIGEKYGIRQTSVSYIKSGRNWGWYKSPERSA